MIESTNYELFEIYNNFTSIKRTYETEMRFGENSETILLKDYISFGAGDDYENIDTEGLDD